MERNILVVPMSLILDDKFAYNEYQTEDEPVSVYYTFH